VSSTELAARVEATDSSVGGGAFPTAHLPSAAVAIASDPTDADARLRHAALPVIGRIADGQLLLDLRSVPEADDARLALAVIAALT
jgi:L-seryl-tRNA(Ser) seleniumtransferase